MKSILISIRPEWVAKILNGEKTIEVRKTAPKCELPIEVYIYCTKGDSLHRNKAGWWFVHDHPTTFITQDDLTTIREQKPFNGKVCAKFTLREVEEIKFHFGYYDMGEWTESYILEKSCFSYDELDDYLQTGKDYDESKPSPVYGYAWHIEDLIIFDKPMELDEFDYPCPSGIRYIGQRSINGLPGKKRPPQSWFYVEERK